MRSHVSSSIGGASHVPLLSTRTSMHPTLEPRPAIALVDLEGFGMLLFLSGIFLSAGEPVRPALLLETESDEHGAGRDQASKHLIFPQPAEAKCARASVLRGATSSSVWWLQKCVDT